MNPHDASTTPQQTRFVEHPARRRAWRAGQRNLAWGVAFLFAALSVISIAVFIGGPRAMIPVLTCVLSFTALWVLARMKLFAQRNGVFFSLAIIALLGAFAALIEQGWIHLANRPTPEPRVATSVAAQPTAAIQPQLPSLVESLRLEPPDASLPRARATRSLTTVIGGKTYRIDAGDAFLFSDEKGSELIISAGEFLARVPSDAMELLAPAPAKANAKAEDTRSPLDKQIDAQATQRAQQQAARRFPGLGRAGSDENKVFLEAYNDLKRRNSDLLDDPDWPIQLAQTLAHRLGWKESGAIEDETATVVESPLAPGTKVLAPEPITAAPAPVADPDIPPPPREPNR